MYARTFFKNMDFDSITVNAYMGEDSVAPFLDFQNKWAIILALTSNNGSSDFQSLKGMNGRMLFEQVLQSSKDWGTDENIMYVVGATRAEKLLDIRKIVPDHFLLVPEVGFDCS